MRLNITKSIGSLLPGTKSFQLMQQLKFMCHHGIIHGVSTNPGRGDSPYDAWWISPYKWLLVFDKRTINRCCCWRVTQGRVGWIPVNLCVKILAPYPKNSWSMDATFPPHISKFMDIHGNFIGILTHPTWFWGANKCVFCWRHHKNPVGTEWKWSMDPPDQWLVQHVAIDLMVVNSD